ncbi:MAG: NTP transferase domain-containing protein [Ignavibacteria bacterium]|nr:NTP transferase domain-containing protein [Ignavibacteria bacterium]
MKGMILAAGFGTRLGKLTEDIPKALVEYKGKLLIEYQIEKLMKCGVNEIVINTHHQSDKMFGHFEKNDYGIRITLLKEEKILGTGGGIINAGNILRQNENSIILNTDIETDFNFRKIIDFHERRNNFVTILIQRRKTSRYLRFNKFMNLVSRSETGAESDSDFAFNGVHIISEKFFGIVREKGFIDIIDVYLNLIKRGYIISGYDAGNSKFKDIGKPENFS